MGLIWIFILTTSAGDLWIPGSTKDDCELNKQAVLREGYFGPERMTNCYQVPQDTWQDWYLSQSMPYLPYGTHP